MTASSREPQEGKRRHKLMPQDLRATLPPLYAQDGEGDDATVYAKFFSPYSAFTLYVTEFDGDDTLYGWAVSARGRGDGEEWGYSSLRELAEATFLGHVPAIERDRFFTPATLAEVKGK